MDILPYKSIKINTNRVFYHNLLNVSEENFLKPNCDIKDSRTKRNLSTFRSINKKFEEESNQNQIENNNNNNKITNLNRIHNQISNQLMERMFVEYIPKFKLSHNHFRQRSTIFNGTNQINHGINSTNRLPPINNKSNKEKQLSPLLRGEQFSKNIITDDYKIKVIQSFKENYQKKNQTTYSLSPEIHIKREYSKNNLRNSNIIGFNSEATVKAIRSPAPKKSTLKIETNHLMIKLLSFNISEGEKEFTLDEEKNTKENYKEPFESKNLPSINDEEENEKQEIFCNNNNNDMNMGKSLVNNNILIFNQGTNNKTFESNNNNNNNNMISTLKKNSTLTLRSPLKKKSNLIVRTSTINKLGNLQKELPVILTVGLASDYSILEASKKNNNCNATSAAFFKTNLLLMENFSIYAVIDGLGYEPSKISQNLKYCLLEYFNSHKNFSNDRGNLKDFLNEETFYNFIVANKYLPLTNAFSFCQKYPKKSNFDFINSGASASLILIINTHIISLSIGNCMSVIYTRTGHSEVINSQHNVYDKLEFERLNKLGAFIEKSRLTDEIMVYSKNNNKLMVPVTRCIGALSLSEIGIINEPEIKELSSNLEMFSYLVIGSSSFWRMMHIQNVFEIISNSEGNNSPDEISQLLIKSACQNKANVSKIKII